MSIKSELEKLHDQILFSYQNIKDDKLYQKDAKVRLNQTTQAILSEVELIDFSQIITRVINTTEMYTRSAMRGNITQNELYDMEQKIKDQAIQGIKAKLEKE